MKRNVAVLVLIAVVALLAWFLLKGSPVAAPATALPDGPVPFTVLEEGTNAVAITDGKNYRIQSQEQLAELWTMIYGENAPPLPTVDFTHEEILAVFSGQKNTGGYDISVKEVVNKNGVRVVTIVHEVPGSDCATTGALTSPFVLVTVPVGSDNLTHEDETITTSCS